MTYEVRLDVFEGPIDLLLHLITRQRVDIYEVSLATITEEYLAAVAALPQTDLESATGFLVVAATLLELKSARLLPARRAADDDGHLMEERDLLLARLVECATFREAGTWLSGRMAAGAGFHGRSAGLEPHFVDLAPDLLARTSLVRIASAAARALAPRPASLLDMSYVALAGPSVKDAILELAGRLDGGGPASFDELCGRGTSRVAIVVRFLALLELFKAGAVDITQTHSFGDIVAVWTGEIPAGEVVAGAEEYTIDLGATGT